jgi:hypothetical protein
MPLIILFLQVGDASFFASKVMKEMQKVVASVPSVAKNRHPLARYTLHISLGYDSGIIHKGKGDGSVSIIFMR